MKNKSGFILNLIAMIYILFSGIGIGVSNKLPWWLMFLAIIGFIITTILGMIVSIKETKVLKYIVLVLAIICAYNTSKGRIWIITNRISETPGDNATTVCFPDER